jgi:hypothetical protein
MLFKGTTQALVATGTYSDGSTLNLSSAVTWSSGNTAVATVSNTPGSYGLVTAIGPGTTLLTAALASGSQAQAQVTVSNLPCGVLGATLFSGGDGSAGNPFIICTAKDLATAAATPLQYDYRLDADIDLTGVSLSPTLNAGNGNVLSGTFDGNHHVISNWSFNFTPTSGASAGYGLFGSIGASGVVKNLGLAHVTAVYNGTTPAAFGILAGTMSGSLQAVYVTGTLDIPATTNGAAFGGLAAANLGGHMTNVYTNLSITGGGGLNAFTGEVVGRQEGTLTNCYSVGPVPPGIGVITSQNTGTITGCYYDSQVTGATNSVGATAETTLQLEVQSTYAGWDFTNVWEMPATAGYPLLR